MQFEIDSRQLRAALICAAKSDIRYYLNGIALEVHRDRVLVLATDGHRLYVGRCRAAPVIALPEGPDAGQWATYILPRDLVERAMRTLKKGSSLPVKITLPDDGVLGKAEINVAGDGFSAALIDGRFPDWRRIAGAQRTSHDPGQFKPEYVADCQRVAECFLAYVKGAAYVDIAHNGPERAALVTFSTTGDALVFLMPLRTFDAGSVRDWLKAETGTDWEQPK
jgi:DNA polymerase III subunit beta